MEFRSNGQTVSGNELFGAQPLATFALDFQDPQRLRTAGDENAGFVRRYYFS